MFILILQNIKTLRPYKQYVTVSAIHARLCAINSGTAAFILDFMTLLVVQQLLYYSVTSVLLNYCTSAKLTLKKWSVRIGLKI